jgi:hypothetical protein
VSINGEGFVLLGPPHSYGLINNKHLIDQACSVWIEGYWSHT